METTLATVNPCIPMSFWQGLPPILQAAVKTSGSVRDIADVVGMITEPKIAKLQEKGGNRSTFGIIKAFLVAMNNNLHIDNSLTPANIENIARMLTSDSELRWWLTLADIDLLCRQIVQGRFGKFYGHFSEQEFTDCLRRYCNERCEHHRLNEENGQTKQVPAEINLGYRIDEDGRIVVPEEKQGVKKTTHHRYMYDSQGNVIGENPSFWAHVVKKEEKTKEEMEVINMNNRVTEEALKIMDRDKIPYIDAITKARHELEKK